MLSVLVISDDRQLRVELEAALPPGRQEPTRWLDGPADSADQPVDILFADGRLPTPLPELLRQVRPRPSLVVLVVGIDNCRGDSPGPPPADLSAADDLLVHPFSPGFGQARWGHWLRRLRDLRRIDQLEARVHGLIRDGNTLRRQAAKFRQQVHLRDQYDVNLRQILARMDKLTRLSHQINSLQLNQIADLCIQQLPALFGVRLASLYLYDESKQLLRLQRHNHPYPINTVISLAGRVNCPMALAIAGKQVLLINDPDWARLLDKAVARPYAHRYATGQCVVAPLFCAGRVVGVLNLADRLDNQPFDDTIDLLPIRQLSELLGASIHNIELYQTVQQQAKTDGMTGLANHSTFMRELAREMHRARRYGGPLSLIMIDVDSLKRINDQMGHLAGDRALQLVARQVVHSVRESDLAARYGGDEFAILLPSTTPASARAVAERIVHAICQIPVVHNRASSHVTVSVGIGQYDGQGTPEHFIEQADAALYQAKREGKNRIAVG